MLNLNNISLHFGSRFLFENVSLTVFDHQKIGLIGANGSGKSSLFKLILGEHQPDSGEINIPRHLRIGHLAQEVPPLDKSALEFVIDGDQTLRQIEQALKKAEALNDYEQMAKLHQQMVEIDAYSAVARAAKLLYGLGFSPAAQQKAVKDFSGGWRTRLSLAQTLMCPADILLLDEPTNHLDLEAIVWLEKWLKQFPGAILMVSHDRLFLDNCVDHIIHLENGQLKTYTGNYTQFETLRAMQLALQQKTYEKQQKKMAHLEEFVRRFRAKASKAKQAQSRLKTIQKIDQVAAAQVNSPFQFEFPDIAKPPNPLLTLTNVQIGYQSNHPILDKINFQISPGMRVGLLGPNGAGKSTLIKLLAGQNKPLQGTVYLAQGVKIGYYAQHQLEQLTLNESPFWHLQQLAPQASSQVLRQFLGGFGFSGDSALSSINNFSGGEKARLALALLVWQAPNLLLLDEPTNHLDLEMRNALTIALQSYDGALILVSHDRYLIQTTTDELFLVANGQVKAFDGDLNDYQKWLSESSSSTPPSATPVIKINKKRLQDQLEKIEKKLEKFQDDQQEIDHQLADNKLYLAENQSKLKTLLDKKNELNKKISELETIWFELIQQLQ